MPSHPKPRPAERKLANHERKVLLWAWRSHTRKLVWQRSGGLCEIRKECKGRVMVESHHVYGHGKDMYDWREQADAQLATCRACHPPKIAHKPAGPKLRWVEEILERINNV